jgi:hypothetical protein
LCVICALFIQNETKPKRTALNKYDGDSIQNKTICNHSIRFWAYFGAGGREFESRHSDQNGNMAILSRVAMSFYRETISVDPISLLVPFLPAKKARLWKA